MSIRNQINVAVLGCGMMGAPLRLLLYPYFVFRRKGQEHVSYMKEYNDLHVRFLCDPNTESLEATLALVAERERPEVFTEEKDLIAKVGEIDLLVIATPNYLHTPQLLRWARHSISILVEKPVAISEKQVRALRAAAAGDSFRANIWVAMEYRYIPAIQKLIQLLPRVGQIKSITIRENRYPFLSKIGEWNKDVDKSGDTLVEKCCHFFDLFRLISASEMHTCSTKVHRGLLWDNYGYDKRSDDPTPIIDSAYVLLDFFPLEDTIDEYDKYGETKFSRKESYDDGSSYRRNVPFQQATMGCLELCMFAEGSRHQEEIIVTGMKGRLEAYLPENKVFSYQRPTDSEWPDRSKPPPEGSIKEEIIDCSELEQVYTFADHVPQHSGYHYCSTAIEWKYLIDAIKSAQAGNNFAPHVSLHDGISAVEMGIAAMKNITNKCDAEKSIEPITAFASKSSEHLMNLAIDVDVGITLAPEALLGGDLAGFDRGKGRDDEIKEPTG